MDGFDAERHLRVVGERALLVREHGYGGWNGPLHEAADALVAAGAIAPARAQAVLDDYLLAAMLRSEGQRRHGAPHAATAPPAPDATAPIALPRVVACDRELALAAGTLRVGYVRLSEDATELGITLRPTGGAPRRPRHGGRPPFARPGGPPSFSLADARGTGAVGHFSGGGSDDLLHGHLTAHPALDPATEWIELDGVRLELAGSPVPVEVSVEPLAQRDPALHHLWQRLATGTPFRPHDLLEGAIATLVAAGALREDDPELAAVRAAAAGLRGAGASSPAALPPQWRSLFGRRGRADGPRGSLAIGAAPEPIDGLAVAVLLLESEVEGFAIEVQTHPAVPSHHPLGARIGERTLAWWAADDRGNHYLGAQGRWSTNGERSAGTVEFWPALDPAAARLELLPTATTHRARIAIELPWAPA